MFCGNIPDTEAVWVRGLQRSSELDPFLNSCYTVYWTYNQTDQRANRLIIVRIFP
jgi:hypothetical protein